MLAFRCAAGIRLFAWWVCMCTVSCNAIPTLHAVSFGSQLFPVLNDWILMACWSESLQALLAAHMPPH